MSRPIARWTMNLMADTMPQARRAWARAMQAELDHVERDAEAIGFALGCLLVAFRERCRAIALPEGARLTFAVLAFGLAAFHLNCAADGVRVLNGGIDPFYASLTRGGAASRAAAEYWRAVTPLMTLGLAMLGAANLGAALFAFRAMPAAFAVTMSVLILAALGLASVIFSVLGYNAGLLTFLAIMGVQAAFSAVVWRFCMNAPAATEE